MNGYNTHLEGIKATFGDWVQIDASKEKTQVFQDVVPANEGKLLSKH